MLHFHHILFSGLSPRICMASLATALAAANRQSLALASSASAAPLTLRVLRALEVASQRRKRWRTRWCGSRSTYESRRNSSNLEI